MSLKEATPNKQTRANATGAESVNPEYGTFEHLYCRQNQCSLEEYEHKVFWHCLNHPLMTPAVWAIYRVQAHVFSLDTNLINLVSQTTSLSDFRNTVEAYDGFDRLHPDTNFIRRTLHLRISRRKLIALAHQVFDQGRQL